MKTKHFFVILFCMFLFIFAACQKNSEEISYRYEVQGV